MAPGVYPIELRVAAAARAAEERVAFLAELERQVVEAASRVDDLLRSPRAYYNGQPDAALRGRRRRTSCLRARPSTRRGAGHSPAFRRLG